MIKFAVNNTIYVESDTYEGAIDNFWELMERAGIAAVVDSEKLPNCFVSEVDDVYTQEELK